MGTSAVLPGASALVQVEISLFRCGGGPDILRPARPVCAFLAGPLEYKGQSEVLWKLDRQREQ